MLHGRDALRILDSKNKFQGERECRYTACKFTLELITREKTRSLNEPFPLNIGKLMLPKIQSEFPSPTTDMSPRALEGEFKGPLLRCSAWHVRARLVDDFEISSSVLRYALSCKTCSEVHHSQDLSCNPQVTTKRAIWDPKIATVHTGENKA